jgi:hypothetical protein
MHIVPLVGLKYTDNRRKGAILAFFKTAELWQKKFLLRNCGKIKKFICGTMQWTLQDYLAELWQLNDFSQFSHGYRLL